MLHVLMALFEAIKSSQGRQEALLHGEPFVLVTHRGQLLAVDSATNGLVAVSLEACAFNLLFVLAGAGVGAGLCKGSSRPDVFSADTEFSVESNGRRMAIRQGDVFLTAHADGSVKYAATKAQDWEMFIMIPLSVARRAREQTLLGWRETEWSRRHAMAAELFGKGFGGQSPIYMTGPYSGQAPTEIVVPKAFGRLGNSVQQFFNATLVGMGIGARTVRLHDPFGLRLNESFERDGFSLRALYRNTPGPEDEPLVLCGDFYAPIQFENVLMGVTEAQVLLCASYVGQMVPDDPGIVSFNPNRTLVAHVRGGDIFSDSKPHEWYTQPPASFYVGAALDARRTYDIDQVHIVHEDDRNPALPVVRSALQALGFGVTVQSKSLMEDFSTLRRARFLAQSFGTFAEAAGMMSSHLLSLWCHNRVGSQTGNPHLPDMRFNLVQSVLEAKGVRIVVACDTSGDYPRPGQWRGCADQRRLIVEFPLECLEFQWVGASRKARFHLSNAHRSPGLDAQARHAS